MKRFRVTKRFYLIAFCAVMLYVGVAFYTQMLEHRKIKAQQREIQEQIDILKLEEQALRYTIRYADTDEYIESIVREKLGWVKRGETRYEYADGE